MKLSFDPLRIGNKKGEVEEEIAESDEEADNNEKRLRRIVM